MKTICVANHKGGTGKTSICIAMGVFFARKKLRVLIVDLDPQGHIAPGFGIDFGYENKSIADILANTEDIDSIIINTGIEGLDLAPSNIKLSLVNENLYNSFKREQRLRKTMNKLYENSQYDIVLLDCPPSLGPLVENALTITDYCLIPCEPSGRSIDGLADFAKKIEEVREGELRDSWYIVLSRVKKSASLTNEIIEDKLTNYSNKILQSKIYEKEAINQAQIAGVPVFDFPRSGSAAESFTNLGEEIFQRCQIN